MVWAGSASVAFRRGAGRGQPGPGQAMLNPQEPGTRKRRGVTHSIRRICLGQVWWAVGAACRACQLRRLGQQCWRRRRLKSERGRGSALTHYCGKAKGAGLQGPGRVLGLLAAFRHPC
mmetsp:Transcript_5938/g.10340  ORF Transcript_5938/g.10340 Transcript_5938/m.10340 type:complete len:118 (+) Transcript_5938:42-395(+)